MKFASSITSFVFAISFAVFKATPTSSGNSMNTNNTENIEHIKGKWCSDKLTFDFQFEESKVRDWQAFTTVVHRAGGGTNTIERSYKVKDLSQNPWELETKVEEYYQEYVAKVKYVNQTLLEIDSSPHRRC